jgi:hypothetical protein
MSRDAFALRRTGRLPKRRGQIWCLSDFVFDDVGLGFVGGTSLSCRASTHSSFPGNSAGVLGMTVRAPPRLRLPGRRGRPRREPHRHRAPALRAVERKRDGFGHGEIVPLQSQRPGSSQAVSKKTAFGADELPGRTVLWTLTAFIARIPRDQGPPK